MASRSDEQILQPGDKAPADGVYEAVHDRMDGELHAHPHDVAVSKGDVMPSCKICRNTVRFKFKPKTEVTTNHDKVHEHIIFVK